MSTAAQVRLYGLPPPEETAKMNLKAQSREEIIETTYDAWLDMLEQYHPDEIFSGEQKFLYRHACEVIKPYSGKLTGILVGGDLKCLAENPGPMHHVDKYNECSSVAPYISALLNSTKITKLSLGSFPVALGDIACGLERGKTVEIGTGVKIFGSFGFECRGTLISHGTVEYGIGIGHDAQYATIINDGKNGEYSMGIRACNSVMLNFGT